MIAAIYARKSTEQHGVADEQKSVARQVEHARAYAARKGWTVDEASVYVDDGISGAEFANRPGFLRLMNALQPRPPFTVLIMSEVSRLGREQIETAYALKQLSVAGVRTFSYLEDRELLLETATDKFLLGAVTFAADLEREKARQRTYDAMARLARHGHVTGGRVFGYDNVAVAGADGKRSHVERRINEAEAMVVRQIFELCVAGTGYSGIAKRLNTERAPAPRPQQGRPAGWAPSTVNEILHRTLYRGEILWNQSRKRNRWGQQNQTARPAEEWVRIAAPGLRIVTDDIWRAAHDRLRSVRAHLEQAGVGFNNQRSSRDVDAPARGAEYLLRGFARCAVCGGSLCVRSRSNGKNKPRWYGYGCLAHHKRGAAICRNALVLPIERVDRAVLTAIAGDVLRPQVVTAIIDGVLEQMKPAAAATDLKVWQRELQIVECQITNLTDAIAAGGGQLPSLLERLTACQARREELAGAITARAAIDVRRFDRKAIVAAIQARAAEWRELLTAHVRDGRELLRRVLAGPLKFTPDGRSYRFEGEAAIGPLLVGLVPLAACSTDGASPSGTANGGTAKFFGIAA